MLKYLPVLFTLILLSNTALSIEVTEQELDQFVHRYLNNHLKDHDQHCHDGYCYLSTSRGNIDVYWRNYGDEEDISNQEDTNDKEDMNDKEDVSNHNRIKIEIDRAQEIVKVLLRQHLDLFDYLSEITTHPELLPYLEKYKALKMRFTSKLLPTSLKIILVGNQHIPPHIIEKGAGVARCDFTEGIVLIT